MTVLFFLRRIGPYHHARFEAAAKLMDLVVVETRCESLEYPWEFEANGSYKVIRFPRSRDGIRGRQLRECVIQILSEIKPTVVVTTGWADPEYHRVAAESLKEKIPLVVISDSRFEDERRSFWKEYIKKIILRSYSAALVAGTASRSYLLRLGMKPDAIFQPWDVVDNDHFRRGANHSISPDERDFICISRFIPKKNLERLLEAFSVYVKRGGARKLHLLGDGELSPRLRSIVTALELQGRVTFPGFVQYDQLPDYMGKALCLVLPSTTDQWGLVVNEAMAAGLPILVSAACGCAADLVENGKNGLVFSPEKTDEIVAALTAIDQVDFEVWNEMRNHSLRKISEWTLSDFAEGLLKATTHAAHQPHSRTFAVVHHLLSR